MMELKDDYFAAEPELVAQLEQIDGLRKVYTTADIAEAAERSQLTPAAHVIYGGDAIATNAQGGALSHVTQTWIVILAVRQRESGQSGKLLAKLIHTLSGHHTTLGNVRRVNAPNRPTFSDGFGYYPLAFEIKFRTQNIKAGIK
ncbi:MAG: phage tail terminator protein [Pontibacterium sp.]